MSLVAGVHFRNPRAVFNGAAGGGGLGLWLASLGCAGSKQGSGGTQSQQTGKGSNAAHGLALKSSCNSRREAAAPRRAASAATWTYRFVNLRSHRVFLTILVVVIAVVVAGLAAGALVSFPASLLIPLLLMAAATALFYIWA